MKQDRLKYIEALEKTRKSENMEHFYNFMLVQYSKFLKREIKGMGEKENESPYKKEFVKDIQASRKSKETAMKKGDLWR